MKGQLVPNTLGVECVADQVRVVASEDALAQCLTDAEARAVAVTIVGGGSNLVLRARLPGLAVLVRLRGLNCERLDGRRWRVTAGAGVLWQELVRATLGRGIGGLENLILIPGSVGAAPVQNIGAYGRELADVLESVTVFDRTRGVFQTLTAAECRFRYRDSRFKGDDAARHVIVRVTLILGAAPLAADYGDVRRELASMGVAATRNTIAEAVTRVRRRKLPDPRRIGNVGSFFKNPLVTARQLDQVRGRLDVDADAHVDADADAGRYKISAARLIDSAGWRGAGHGSARVWSRQPLVLVNRGGATGREVLDLARRIRDDVLAKYGVALELEPAVKGLD